MQARGGFVWILGVALAGAVAAAAESPALGSVKPGTYKIEPGHTQVGFTLSHFGLSYYSGIFSGVSGTLHFDPAHVSSSRLDITIPIDSVYTTVQKLTDELKDPDWFDAAKYPAARFVSSSITTSGAGDVAITGNFTLHGLTKPLVLKGHLVGVGINPIDKMYTIGFQVTGTVKRTEFGVSKYAPKIGDDVDLTIAAAFELQDGE